MSFLVGEVPLYRELTQVSLDLAIEEMLGGGKIVGGNLLGGRDFNLFNVGTSIFSM